MPDSELQTINIIVSELRSEEVRRVRQYLSMNGQDKIPSKRSILFEALMKKRGALTWEEALEATESSSNNALRLLKNRLKKDILNVMLTCDADVSLTSDSRKARYECNTLTFKGELLIFRGRYLAGAELLKEALKIALTFLFEDDIVRICDLLAMAGTTVEGMKAQKYYSSLLEKYIAELKYTHIAKAHFVKLGLLKNISYSTSLEYVSYGEAAMKELDEISKVTTNDNFLFYYLMTGISYYRKIARSVEKSMDYVKRFEDFISSSKIYSAAGHFGGVKMHYTSITLQTGEYEKAAQYAKEAIPYFPANGMNSLQNLENIFWAYFHLNKLSEARKTLLEGMKHSLCVSQPVTMARWLFFESLVTFKEGNYDKFTKQIRSNVHIAEDPLGWLLGARLLELMKYVKEKDNGSWVENSFSSLSAQLYRHKEVSTDRLRLIISILKTYERNFFDKEKTKRQMRKALQDLKDGQGKYFWEPTGYEAIRFDTWFENL